MDNKQCIRCGTRSGDNSSQCWYCHAMLPHAAPEPQAVGRFDGGENIRPNERTTLPRNSAAPEPDSGEKIQRNQRTTIVYVVLCMHVVSEALGDLTPDDDEILHAAVDHTSAMLETADDLPNGKGHKVALAIIHAAEAVDRR